MDLPVCDTYDIMMVQALYTLIVDVQHISVRGSANYIYYDCGIQNKDALIEATLINLK